MTPTKYNLAHHGWLKQMEKNLEEMIFSRNKKLQLVSTFSFEYDDIEGEVCELKETLQHLSLLLISYESTFQIN